jgi:hypothetical protein
VSNCCYTICILAAATWKKIETVLMQVTSSRPIERLVLGAHPSFT